MTNSFSAGDFTGLAKDYSANRPDYSNSVLQALLGLLDKSPDQIDFVDVGAGTGIWTSMVTKKGVKTVRAVEPNDDMRMNGITNTTDLPINWLAGSAEATGIKSQSADWLSMASSFHWTNFEKATAEFYRVLRPYGHFTALWNPRFIEDNPLLVEIEQQLKILGPNIKRVSSGRSGITDTLTDKLWNSTYFEDVVYMEGRHVISMSIERYIGAWRSVNDLRVQLGPSKFTAFLDFIEEKTAGLNRIDATYLTRAWSARRKG